MPIGDRIAERRKQLGMTQDELAKRMGYKSKAAISKIETNVNDITQSTVVKFAEVLDTSINYLMGWDYESKSNSAPILSSDESQLIEDYRGLTPPGQEYIRQTMAMAKQSYGEKNLPVSHLETAE